MGVQAVSSAIVIPFRMPAGRARVSSDGRRGEILFFTGVRYERQVEPGPEPLTPGVSDGQTGARRRRRR
jgi:hypothetical protein